MPLTEMSYDDERWRSFVASRADATPFHDPAWAKLLAETYGMAGFALADVDGETVRGGVPLLAPPRLPGRARRLVSLPFTDVLHPLAPAAGEADLAAALDSFRAERDVARIELRGTLEGATSSPSTAVLHVLALDGDVEQTRAGFSKMRRRNIRIAESAGLTVRRGSDERDMTDAFFSLYVATRRRLGVPSQPKRYFRLLWRRVIATGLGFLLVAEREGTPVAAAVFLSAYGTTIYKYGASDAASWGARPNDLVMWTAIREACEQGQQRFDFGRSDLDNAGLRDFKRSWGAVETPLVYSSLGAAVSGSPSGTPRLLGEVIRRSPAWVTRATGELLYRFAA